MSYKGSFRNFAGLPTPSSNYRARNVKSVVNSNLGRVRPNSTFQGSSNYLREVFNTKGASPTKRSSSTSSLASRITNNDPKTKEDTVEEMMIAKRKLLAVNQENRALKTQIKRMETELAKHGKKFDEFVAESEAQLTSTLSVNSSNSTGNTLQINSLKQKIMRLEQTLKDRENALNKLKMEMKTTKTEELKSQMDILYKEVLRLQYNQSHKGGNEVSSAPKEVLARMRSLTESLNRQTEACERLEAENENLKSQLKHTNRNDSRHSQDLSKSRDFDQEKVEELLREKETLHRMVKKLQKDKLDYRQKLDISKKQIAGIKSSSKYDNSTRNGSVHSWASARKGRQPNKGSPDQIKLPEILRESSEEETEEEEDSESVVVSSRRGRGIKGSDSGIDDAASIINAATRAHIARKNMLAENSEEDGESSEDEVKSRHSAASSRHSRSSRISRR